MGLHTFSFSFASNTKIRPGLVTVTVFTLFLILLCSINCKKNSDLHRSETPLPRIISFAPSITETMYALNLQQHLVGVTDYCTYPPEASALPKVGGYINPNYEQILRLKPDMAILLKEHGPLISFLKKYKVKIVTIDNENLQGIFNSIRTVAEACDVAPRADSLVWQIQQTLQQESSQQSEKPKILFCIGRDRPGSGNIGTVFLAGPKSFYNEIIQYAGGINAYNDSLIAYPSVAAEGILRLAPDIIIDAMASNKGMAPEKVRDDWNQLAMLPAVTTGAVYALTGSYISIPGPRVALLCESVRNCINDWTLRKKKGDACPRSK